MNAKEARQMTEAANQIIRKNEIQKKVDACLHCVKTDAQGGKDRTNLSVGEDLILDVTHKLADLGFKIVVLDVDRIQIQW